MSVLPPPSLADVPSSRAREGAGAAGVWLALSYLLGPAAAVVLASSRLADETPLPVAQMLGLGAHLTLTAVLLAGLLPGLHRRPLARHLSILLLSGMAGLAALVGVGIGRGVEGSLAFGLLTALLGAALVCATIPWQRRVRQRRFALLEGGVADELRSLPQARWLSLPEDGTGVRRRAVDAIVVDLHAQHPTAVLNALASHALRGVPLLHAAAAHELLTERVSLRFLSEESLQEYRRVVTYDVLKRGLDVLVVLASLPVVLPLALVVALVVRMESPGPILFRQRRVGHLGRPFTMFKFRSMDHRETALEAQFAQAEDARVTRVGRFIRKFRVDELPQFWNVLRGDMSIIGPRPEQVPFVETFEEVIPLYPYRHTVRPGITGWSQVKLGYAASLHEAVEKLEYDLYYVKHLSFSLDLLILFKTLRTIVTGYGAR